MTVIGIGHYRNVRWFMRECFENASQTFASQIAKQAVSPMYSEDADQLQILASQSLYIPSLRSVGFFNQAGKLIFTGTNSSISQDNSEIFDVREVVYLTNLDQAASAPSQIIGEVRLRFSYANLNYKLANVRSSLVLAEVFLCIIFALLMLFLERWVTQPLINLTAKVKSLAEGDLSVRVEVPRSASEITILCDGVNHMADSIEQNRQQLERLNSELEQRVLDRTMQLESANKELEAFSYSVSHDLRAPLRGIDGWSLALQEDYHDCLDEQGHTYIDRVRSETQRMGILIDGLLQLSRFGRQQLQVQTVDLTAIASSIASRLSDSNPDRHIEFNIEAGLTTNADPTLLEIVLSNFFENAVKFSRLQSQARITFNRVQVDGQPAFVVTDNGAGFDMAYYDNLFKPFQRLHKKSEFPGTGIGLVTVARIVHRHGGRVWATSEPGQGSSFYFTIAEKNYDSENLAHRG